MRAANATQLTSSWLGSPFEGASPFSDAERGELARIARAAGAPADQIEPLLQAAWQARAQIPVWEAMATPAEEVREKIRRLTAARIAARQALAAFREALAEGQKLSHEIRAIFEELESAQEQFSNAGGRLDRIEKQFEADLDGKQSPRPLDYKAAMYVAHLWADFGLRVSFKNGEPGTPWQRFTRIVVARPLELGVLRAVQADFVALKSAGTAGKP